MAGLRRLAREPLLHFLILGAALFGLAWLLEDGADQTSEIVVDAAQIERLAEDFRRTWQRPPTRAELEGLIEDHVREEVFYREALALGLDRNDPAIRRRLRQKMEFLNADLTAQMEPDQAALRVFLEEHAERYREPARYRFVQVYFSRERHGKNARRDAEQALARLQGGEMADPTALGDPLLLEPGYEEMREDEVARLFGPEFARRLAGLPLGRWAGPIASAYGLHLVRIDAHTEPRLPPLHDIRTPLERDWRAAQTRAAQEAFYQKLQSRYRITVRRPAWLDAAEANND